MWRRRFWYVCTCYSLFTKNCWTKFNLKCSIFDYITPCRPLLATCFRAGFLRQHVLRNVDWLSSFNGLHGVISQRTKFVLTTAMRTTNPTELMSCNNFVHRRPRMQRSVAKPYRIRQADKETPCLLIVILFYAPNADNRWKLQQFYLLVCPNAFIESQEYVKSKKYGT
jgi:hypothetical protein